MRTQRTNICAIAAATAALSLSSAVYAGAAKSDNDRNGYYAELRAGASFVEDADNDSNINAVFGGATGFDTGYTTGFAFGRDLSAAEALPLALRNLRVEGEYAYAENDIEDGGRSNAEFNVSTFMANVYYDFPAMTAGGKLRPYIGAGVGAAMISAEGASLRNNDDTTFAYQLRAGLAYQLRPDLEIAVGYRFLDADDPRFETRPGRFESEYRTHTVETGVRYSF